MPLRPIAAGRRFRRRALVSAVRLIRAVFMRAASVRVLPRAALLLAAFALASCVGARGPSDPSGSAGGELERGLPVPVDLQAGVLRASAIGSSLFVLDASTALAWDALEARPGGAKGIGHYLAFLGGNDDGHPDGTVLVMFFTDEYVPRLAYQVRVVPGSQTRSEVLVRDPPAIVHEPMMTLLNARQLALEALPPSEQAMNPVLIPQRNGQLVIYALAASAEPNVAVLGRHFRVEISYDGTEVESVTALPGNELVLPTRDGSGHRLPALAVAARGTEHPTETHVFASRMANLPIYVTTERGRWRVRASVIDYLGDL